VKLAQAIVHDPPVLLLDEPTSGLDPAGRDTMLNLIKQLHRNFGKSILLSTHLLADVQAVCERVVFLANGELRRTGKVEELLTTQVNCYRVKLSGNVDAARAVLLQHGYTIDGDCETEAKITLPPGKSANDLYRHAASHGAVVQRLVPHTETLEDYFFRTLGDG
jgi:ABC-2 type transport system ATP-binding protein